MQKYVLFFFFFTFVSDVFPQFRCGTESTNLTLDVFENDYSMFGGIAHPLVRSTKGSVAVSFIQD